MISQTSCIRTRQLGFVFLAVFAAQQAYSQTGDTGDWNRFRGPNGDGINAARGIPVRFAPRDFLWKTKLPGTGYGSPAVWGDDIFVMSGDMDTAERTLVCLGTRDGAIQWKQSYPSTPYHLHQYNNYGTTTPAVDAERVYSYWATRDAITLIALDHRGNEQWRRNLGPFESNHGGGTSPMLYDDMVIVANDQMGDSFLIAVDKSSGETRWKVPRRSVDNGTAYAVPCVYQPAGQQPQLIFASRAHGLTGVDPATGRMLWELNDLFPLRVVSSPVVAGDLVMATCGQGGGGKRLVAVRPASADGETKARLVYDLTRSVPYVPTPLAVGDLLFTIHDGTGIATCLHAPTGEVRWQERLDGSFFGSPVCAGGNVYCIAKDGQVVVFRATDQYQLLARNPLGELSYATPAVAAGRMYLRTNTHLIAVGRRRER